MLEKIGVRSMDDLLVDIPQSLRLDALQLPNGLSELETMAQVSGLASRNRVFPDRLTFRGGGVYRRFIPAAVAEAAMMAYVHTGRNEVLVAGYVHPEYVQVLRAFGEGRGIKVRKGDQPNKKTAAIIFQQPDFLGLLVDARQLTQAAHDVGALAIACVDPISLAMLAPPGEYGADIAVGEGQQLGLSPSFGGPHVGFVACKRDLVRKLPGRLVGTAYDAAGRRGYVLALAAREQHIRREKATSNIC